MTIRVLHAVESLEPEAGSVAILLRGLVNALRAKGVESETIAFNTTIDFPGTPDSEPRTSVRANSRRLKPAAQGKVAARFVEPVDVVHLHGWGHPLARNLAGAAGKANKPYVISPHGSLSYGPYHRRRWRNRVLAWFSEKPLVRGAAVVTALNEREECDLRSHRINSNILRLPYGVEASEYAEVFEKRQSSTGGVLESGEFARAEARGSGEGRRILMLGEIHPIEGLVPLLKSLSELGPVANGWNVVIAGRETGDWRKMLEAAILRKGGQDRVLFTPASDLSAQRARLAGSSFLAAPSLHIRCPVSIMQAVAAGVPVLASTCTAPPGLEDVIRVFGSTRHELKFALRAMLGLSDKERAAMAQRARGVVRSRYDWSVLVDEYLRLYQSLVEDAFHEQDGPLD